MPVALDVAADSFAYEVWEEIALIDARVRAHVSYAIAGAFVLANVMTLLGVGFIFSQDNANIVAKV